MLGRAPEKGGGHFRRDGFLKSSDPCLHYVWLHSLSNVLQASNMHLNGHQVVKLLFLFGCFI